MRGFEHAPFSWVVLLVSSALTFILGSVSRSLAFDVVRISGGEYFRLLGCQMFFPSVPQAVVGAFLVYTLRQLERMMGTRKLGAFLFVSYVLTLVLQLAFVVVLQTLMGGRYMVPASGPYFFIFGLLPLFARHVPTLRGTRFFGGLVTFSEKTWTYLLAAQIACSDGAPSVCSALAGYAAGSLYMVDPLRLSSFRFPRFVDKAFGTVGSFFVSLMPDTTPAAAAAAGGGAAVAERGGRHAPGSRGGGMYGTANTPAAPSAEVIASLTALGFDEAAVLNALRRTNNNPDAAANLLLTGGG
jgi:hypothetical protein